ncbi:hypothetical protein EDD37DRAFT_347993 [Exophiala viscosa]|uniref:G domain-containing protein n=1 Tax=Exophiala viscosa TaxID=2486360 RepID=A0AAN6DXR1_9EURO|nr:hypothetical protein EDD36DRAFT_263704 [Exophiala viscosa]KAI1626456.1 hypothetical protein EDD37DRAFT_347993 [Exophiala viscosa]
MRLVAGVFRPWLLTAARHARPNTRTPVLRTRVPSDNRALSAQVPVTVAPRGDPSEIPTEETRTESSYSATPDSPTFSSATFSRKRLPVSCPGCGALTQDVDPGQAGYYTRSRKAVKTYLRGSAEIAQQPVPEDDGAADRRTERAGSSNGDTGVQQDNGYEVTEIPSIPPPVCDRCHHLIHESRGIPIAHPSVEDIADSIAESPHPRNHVYHVMDAADFPMSLIPSIYKNLSLAKPRSQNRRSQHAFSSKPSLSFIITRSDLLGSSRDSVDRLMPKFSSILRTALGRSGQKLRLGNVHLVSSKRGWWTKDIKQSIWERGGGNWLIGKFNVGKSNLFEVLFPKASDERAPVYEELERQQTMDGIDTPAENSFFSEKSLLPPPQPEVPFPSMPLVSSLPGTTASPIRLPFGNKKGELIDMPGLERSGLDRYVRPEDKLGLVMTHRPTVSQHNIKPGQSLVLGGGLVRITPKLDESDRSTIMMAYPFVPLKAHVTSTEKALGTQSQDRESGIESILADGTGLEIASAGKFSLNTDVTKSRAGSVIRAGVDPAKLPFQVYATDILIEGVGWVELVCQVRKGRRMLQAAPTEETPVAEDLAEPAVPRSDEVSIDNAGFVPFASPIPNATTESTEFSNFPQVEIFTPQGKYIGQRQCLDIWQAWNTGKQTTQTRGGRPRKPMSGVKKRDKMLHRANVSTNP